MAHRHAQRDRGSTSNFQRDRDARLKHDARGDGGNLDEDEDEFGRDKRNDKGGDRRRGGYLDDVKSDQSRRSGLMRAPSDDGARFMGRNRRKSANENTFQDDGSFMDQFKGQQESRGKSGGKGKGSGKGGGKGKGGREYVMPEEDDGSTRYQVEHEKQLKAMRDPEPKKGDQDEGRKGKGKGKGKGITRSPFEGAGKGGRTPNPKETDAFGRDISKDKAAQGWGHGGGASSQIALVGFQSEGREGGTDGLSAHDNRPMLKTKAQIEAEETSQNGGGPSTVQEARDSLQAAVGGKIDVKEDLNELVAKQVRAKLMKNTKLYDELQIRIDRLREAKESAGAGAVQPKTVQKHQEGEVIVLSKVDAQGRILKGAIDRGPDPSGVTEHSFAKEKRPKAFLQRHKDGERQEWFRDDGNQSLDDLVAEAKTNTASMDDNFADAIVRQAKYTGPVNPDDEYDHDMGIDQYSDRRSRMSREKREQKEREHAINETRKMNTAQDRDPYWLHGSNFRLKDKVIAVGNRVYLALPPRDPICEGHCYIIPIEMEVSTRNADEDVWTEMRNFKKCLLIMFAQMGKDCIFLETAMKLSQQKHTIVEAIPLPAGKAAQASGYFKEALTNISAEEEMEAVHKRIIDTRGKGLRACIPKNFPYFHVEFGINGGFLHMIEDEENWDRQFGHHVAAGMIKKQHRGKQGESQKDGDARVSAFKRSFAPHDWTAQLREEAE